MSFDIRAHTHLLVVAGSRAYGLHTADSDVDVLGCAVPPVRYLYGFAEAFEQCNEPDRIAVFTEVLQREERAATERSKLEGTVYDLRKLARLAADCNPNILDVLFCRDAEVRVCTPIGAALRDARDRFLSVRARHSYAGYATAQLKRIQGHRAWLLEPPERAPTRAEYDLPEHTLLPKDQLAAAAAAVRKQLDRWEIDYGALPPSQVVALQERIASVLAQQQLGATARWEAAARTVGLDDNLIAVMDRERRYTAAKHHWRQFQRWRRQRNPKRAALEAAHGYDTKHGAHLIRLLRMGVEILRTGRVRVWRGDTDAEELLAIRRGAWPYERLLEEAQAALAELDALDASGGCAVPKKPDRAALDALVVELVARAVG